MHPGQGHALVCRWPIHSVFFWVSPPLCYYVHDDEMTHTLIRLVVQCSGCICHVHYSRSEMAVAPEGEKGVRHPTLCVHIFNQCFHSNCLCNKLWPAAGVWYRPTSILLMDYMMQARRANIVYQRLWRFSKVRMNCTISYPCKTPVCRSTHKIHFLFSMYLFSASYIKIISNITWVKLAFVSVFDLFISLHNPFSYSLNNIRLSPQPRPSHYPLCDSLFLSPLTHLHYSSASQQCSSVFPSSAKCFPLTLQWLLLSTATNTLFFLFPSLPHKFMLN